MNNCDFPFTSAGFDALWGNVSLYGYPEILNRHTEIQVVQVVMSN